MNYSKRNLYQIQKADTYKKKVLVIPIHAMHFLEYLDYAHAFMCHYKVEIPLEWYGESLSAIRPLNPTWYGDMNSLLSFPQAPV